MDISQVLFPVFKSGLEVVENSRNVLGVVMESRGISYLN